MPAPQPEPRTRPAWLIPVIATTVVVGLTAATAGYLLASGNKADNAATGTSAIPSPSASTATASSTPTPKPTPLVVSIPGISGISGIKQGTWEDAVKKLTDGGIAKDNIGWVSPFSDQPKPADPAGMTVCAMPAGHDQPVSPTTKVELSVIEKGGSCPAVHGNPKPKPSCTETGDYKKVSDREFKQMVRNTTAHLMGCFTIYGEIVQADSATGTTSVRANTCGEKKQPKYGFLSDCDTNSILTELISTGKLNGVVKGDLFEAKVQVGIDTTYQTTLGGSMTAPTFYVKEIKSYGSVD
ncbi:hypothetical protein [Streptomyces sp. NBC_00347]|uniref:hypothetical protein n=1 Tax=Streptomyces sp. NBC_00347 TaxID=2975721 RepID=UPI00225173E5|nr:hypothetical protein [Streptomyces sp. NBC_00347]MCX5125489.1 hypothetical protein [Streptomyces sp. NBC_00347]